MKRVLLLLGLLFSTVSVFAEDNVLQTIEIEPVKDTYNIVLVSDKAVDVKKTIQDSGKINIVLKDIRASKTLNTVYNNVANVDTVMVEQQGNNVNIFFQAENAEAATVTFDSVIPAPVKTPNTETKQLKLNNPIESYAPIYNENFEQTKTSNLFNTLKSKSAFSGIKDSMDEAPVSDTANKFISFGLVGLLVFAVARLFKKSSADMKIGLAQQFSSNEAQNYGGIPQPMAQYHTSTGAKPFTAVNYGLNAYKNENRNPYETAPMQFHNPRLRNFTAQKAVEPVPQPAMVNAQVNAAPLAHAAAPQKMTTPVNTAPVNQSNPNIDNLKFLESMTAIYEKSGRHDLARGLKASLNKNNIQ